MSYTERRRYSEGLDGPGLIPGSAKFSSSPQHPDRLLRPTQRHVQSVPGALSPGFMRGRDIDLTTHHHPMQRSREMELYLHSPIFLHGIVLE
jgi:hypothetical protein